MTDQELEPTELDDMEEATDLFDDVDDEEDEPFFDDESDDDDDDGPDDTFPPDLDEDSPFDDPDGPTPIPDNTEVRISGRIGNLLFNDQVVDFETGEILPAETEDDFETLCEKGSAARRSKEDAQWQIGAIASKIVSKYGEAQIDEFARRIGLSKSSVYDYRKSDLFYEFSKRLEFLEEINGTDREHEVVFYGHFRAARRLGSEGPAYAFLLEVASNTWTVDQAAHVLDKRLKESDDEDEDTDQTPEPVTLLEDAPVQIVSPRWVEDQHYGEYLVRDFNRDTFNRVEQAAGDKGLKISLTKQ